MARHNIGSEESLVKAGDAIVLLEGRSIGVFHRSNKWFALRNVCPHHGAELCRGTVSGTTGLGNDGRPVYRLENRVLRCPWHGFEFDLATGRSLADPDRLRVKTYRVAVEDGSVFVTI